MVDVKELLFEQIKRAKDSVKAISPSAKVRDSMSIGVVSSSILWRPNNYRLGVFFKGKPKGVLGVRARHTGLVFGVRVILLCSWVGRSWWVFGIRVGIGRFIILVGIVLRMFS